MASGREKLNKISEVLNVLIFINSLIPNFLNKQLFVLFRNLPGNLGLLFRYIILKNLSNHCGKNVAIYEGVFLKSIEDITIGSNVSLHSMCYVDATGGLIIGDDVSIAHASTIMTTSHTWEDKTKPIKYNRTKCMPVHINNDVWIGAGSRILAGVTLGSRVVVAAGAVVNKNVNSNTVVGGVPAKLLKSI